MKTKCLLPLIQEILNRLTKSEYFTKLNIVAVFNKIKIVENEKWKLVLIIKYGLFEFLIMNFGFRGIPSTFPYYINDIFHEYFNIFCSAYIDDIFIYNKMKKKQAKHVQLVLPKFQKIGL